MQQDNIAVLHTDASVLPLCKRAWSAWNYRRSRSALLHCSAEPLHHHALTRSCSASSSREDDAAVTLHYLISKIQVPPFLLLLLLQTNRCYCECITASGRAFILTHVASYSPSGAAV